MSEPPAEAAAAAVTKTAADGGAAAAVAAAAAAAVAVNAEVCGVLFFLVVGTYLGNSEILEAMSFLFREFPFGDFFRIY